ncbi:MAG: hypothetical protein KF789_08780 [Bdellovibrionaceae bacterium]|nr:hypothetical protein [Pseudobdellovibrionaceae bacterium]
MPISRKAGANGVEETQALKAAGVAVEDPDLSAFLPGGQRRVAGGILPGLSGCRIPNPQKPNECAVPHGPSANIWSKMKERFEELRFMRPAQFFMNEE